MTTNTVVLYDRIGNTFSGIWVGPMSLNDAMAIHWNAEAVTFTVDSRTVPLTYTYLNNQNPATALTTPKNRVCGEIALVGFDTSGPDSLYAQTGSTWAQSGSSYYVGCYAEYFKGEYLTVTDANYTGLTPGVSYAGTIFGKSVTWYRYHLSGSSPYTGTDNAQISATYYTYP